MWVVSHNRRKALRATTGIALAVSTVLFSGAARADDATAKLQAQIDALQAQINAMKSQSSSSGMSSLVADDGTLTWHGITLYGTIDVGVSGQSHGSSYNANQVTGVGELLQKNGGGAKWAVTPGAMEQSKIGIKGKEALTDDLDAVFKLEAGINPVSGVLSGSQQAQVSQNGKSFITTSTNADSSRAGQPFEGAAFGGVSSHTYGTLTFGRHTTPMADNVTNYDPQGTSYAFSPIEWSGFTAGGGDTEDARLDDSIKYNGSYGPVRFAGIYQLPGNTNSYGGDDGFQANLGLDYGRLSLDALYGEKHDAINTGSSAALTGSNANLLNATVSDNRFWALYAKYDLNPVKIMGGYEHLTFNNPRTPLSQSAVSLGGYNYNYPSGVNQTQYTNAEIFHVLWAGARWSINPKLTLAASYYMYIQQNYSGLDNGVCVATQTVAAGAGSKCAGTEEMASISVDYQLTKRFDTYAGVMYNKVNDGIYYGYLHNNNISPAAGLRFKF